MTEAISDQDIMRAIAIIKQRSTTPAAAGIAQGSPVPSTPQAPVGSQLMPTQQVQQVSQRMPTQTPQAAAVQPPMPGRQVSDANIMAAIQAIKAKTPGGVPQAGQVAPPAARSHLEDAGHFLADVGRETAQELTDMGVNFINRVTRGLGALPGRDIRIPQIPTPHIAPEKLTTAEKLTGTLGSIIATLPLPFGEAEAGLKALPFLRGSGLLSRLSRAGLLSGAFSGVTAPAGEVKSSAVIGGLGGAALQLPLEVLNTPFVMVQEALRKNFGRGLREAKEIAKRIGTAAANIGAIVGNSSLRHFYNTILRQVPFSPVQKFAETLGGKLLARAHDLSEHFRGKVPTSKLNDTIIEGLKANKARQEAIKSDLYNLAGQEAEASNFELKETPNLKEAAKIAFERAAEVTGVDKLFSPKQEAVIERALAGQQPLEPTLEDLPKEIPPGPPIKNFNEAMATWKRYGKIATEVLDREDLEPWSLFRGMQKGLEEDITKAAEEKGNPLLIQRWKEARNHFRNEVLPNREPPIDKLLNKGTGVEKIGTFFRKKWFHTIIRQLKEHEVSNPKDNTRRLLAFKILEPKSVENPLTKELTTDPKALRDNFVKLSTIKEVPELQDILFTGDEMNNFKDIDAFLKALDDGADPNQPRPHGMKALALSLIHPATLSSVILKAAAGAPLSMPGIGTNIARILASPRLRQRFLTQRSLLSPGINELIRNILLRLPAVAGARRGKR